MCLTKVTEILWFIFATCVIAVKSGHYICFPVLFHSSVVAAAVVEGKGTDNCVVY